MWDQVEQALNQSMTRVLAELVGLLPSLLALIIAVLFAAFIGWCLGFPLRYLLRRIRFDEKFAAWGLSSVAELSPANSPTLLVARIVFWLVVLCGFLIGIAAFDGAMASNLTMRLLAYLPHVIAAALVLLVGSFIARFLARSVLIGAVNINLQYARLLSTGVKWMILVLTVAMALDHLSIGGGILYLAFAILFGGIVLALTLAVGLGSKELVSRSLEREAGKTAVESEEPFRHL
jgi:Conserved TM helix